MAELDFSGRTALITGAASGIGAACAQWLERHGAAELVLVDLDEAGLQELDLSCQAKRIVGDVSDPALWDEIESSLTQLDHAVINAGIASGCPIVDQDFDGWRRMLAVNLDGTFLGLRTSLRVMKKCGGKSAVLTSSIVGVDATAGTAAYGSSKAAIAHLARIAAAEHTGDQIRINAIAPGRVDTPIWTKTEQFQDLEKRLGSREAALESLSDAAPLGGFATAELMAGQIGFLLSDEAWNITGSVLVSDGGYSL
ncbi:MAG: SDR family oxidoreductase [Novosphingobium sp.]|nr:SDR family oxidoreductase [Novosphingobium sp.]MCP5402763.1 SDR family oxidoreductase [Novosphingobium sp.]